MNDNQLKEGQKIKEEIAIAEKALAAFNESLIRMKGKESPDNLNYNSFYLSIQRVNGISEQQNTQEICKAVSPETYRNTCLFMLHTFIFEVESKIAELNKRFEEL